VQLEVDFSSTMAIELIPFTTIWKTRNQKMTLSWLHGGSGIRTSRYQIG
jgi:hypothetical protein